MFIEDDPMLAEMYDLFLKVNGHESKIVQQPELAVGEVESWRPECIFLDLMMPKMNGNEVLIALKNNPATATIPTVMLTNYHDEQLAKECLAKGAIGFLLKSDFTAEWLERYLVELLDHPA